MPLRCYPILAILLLLLTITRSAQADAIDDYIRAQMTWLRIPGLSLAVIKNGKVVRAKGYGLANIETNTAATPQTVYKIGSVSKQFLAAGVLCLVQDGKLALDDKIDKYLENSPDAWKDITLRQVLSHTSGIVREPPGFDPYKIQPDAGVIQSAYPVPLRFPSGQKWEYSNTGYYCVAEILRKVAGKPWSEFLQERVFTPAGMSVTQVSTRNVIAGRASGYEARATLQNAENWLAVRPSGAYLSTVLDFARWDQALNSSTILSEASRTQMWTPARLSDGKAVSYGFGWFIDQVQGHKRLAHSGGVPGFVCEYQRYPDDHVSVVIMANIGNRDLGDIARNIAAQYVPALMALSEPTLPEKEPVVARQLQQIVNGLARGKVDRSQFTPQMAGNLEADIQQGFGEILGKLGGVRSLTLLARSQTPTERTYRYRLNFKHLALYLSCTLDSENRITRFAIQD